MLAEFIKLEISTIKMNKNFYKKNVKKIISVLIEDKQLKNEDFFLHEHDEIAD